MLRHINPLEQRDAGCDGSGGEVLGQLAPDHGLGHHAGGGDLPLHLPADVRAVPRRPFTAESRQGGLDHGLAVQRPDRCPRHGPYRRRRNRPRNRWWSKPEGVQLLEPAAYEVGAVSRDDLVGTGLRPGTSVPRLLKPGARFLVGVVGAPLGLVALGVVPDLCGPRAERPDEGSELDNFSGGWVERVSVTSECGAEGWVAHDRGGADPVDGIEAVADPDGVDAPPQSGRPDSGVDLQVQVSVRVPGPRGVVPHDRRLDLLDGHLQLPTPWADPGRGVLRDPPNDLLRCLLLGGVVCGGEFGMHRGDQRPRLRAVHRNLDEPHPLGVCPQPTLRLPGLHLMPGDPVLIGLTTQRTDGPKNRCLAPRAGDATYRSANPVP